MLDFIKKNIFIGLIFIITLSVGFLTFLTFIDKSFIELNDFNLQILLLINSVLLILFFTVITTIEEQQIQDQLFPIIDKQIIKYPNSSILFNID